MKCYCGNVVTGAPSGGRWGKYYYYHKCTKSHHLNLSADKAHCRLLHILGLMSLPDLIKGIWKESEVALRIMIKDNAFMSAEKEKELKLEDAKLPSIEEK